VALTTPSSAVAPVVVVFDTPVDADHPRFAEESLSGSSTPSSIFLHQSSDGVTHA
jgi:hypothetical protein